ncbi:hypothetical protein E0F15_20620 [Frankia sp. B2]|uniref:hypothetical protein n=1 Tax=Frankia sp. B2 TaxID=2541730 RepID=UPI00106B7C6E|nr:hypothetical protein [Frankia sp. B2]TFE25063.1 hypothetical protein E0F15_20620 [Frankia sp. B2]
MPSPDPHPVGRATTRRKGKEPRRRGAREPRSRTGRDLRGPLTLIALGLLLLIVVSWPAWTFATAPAGGSDPRQGVSPHSTSPPPMSPSSSPGVDGRDADDAHTTGHADASAAAARPDAALAGDSPPSDAVLQAGLDATPAAGVPPITAAAAVAVARQVLTADITGVGRAAFPGYWPSAAFQPTYHAVHIQAATVSTATVLAQGGARQLDVTLLWTGTQADGVITDSQQATVHLRSAGDSWAPIHPWDS